MEGTGDDDEPPVECMTCGRDEHDPDVKHWVYQWNDDYGNRLHKCATCDGAKEPRVRQWAGWWYAERWNGGTWDTLYSNPNRYKVDEFLEGYTRKDRE